jgi:putative DNA primase/helicase
MEPPCSLSATLASYAFDCFDICPMLTLVSPIWRCGKTQVLKMLSALAFRALASSNITPSAIFRAIERWHPTLLVDEYDTIKENEELRGILNSGHTRRLAYVIRNVSDDHEPRRFSTWGPKALALIGRPPHTIEDRSIILRMRRKTRGEKVERLRADRLFIQLRELREKMLRWAKDNAAMLRQAEPEIPEGLHDRAADNWEPLLAVADLAGDPWPARARAAAASLSGEAESEAASVLLLQDIRAVFEECGEDKISSSDLCAYLAKLEHRPWPEWGKQKKPITQPALAVLLKPFGITPTDVRIGKSLKGYKLEQFTDAFNRYIPSSTNEGVPSRDTATIRMALGLEANF